MAVLIDSNVFIALERRGAAPDEVLTLIPDEPVALAAVSAPNCCSGWNARIRRSGAPEENASWRPC